MKCKECGSKIPVGSVYCEKCGKEVQIVPDFNVLDDEIESAVSIENVINSDNEIHPSLVPRDRRRQVKLAALIGACIAVVIVIFIIGAIHKSKENSFDYQTTTADDLIEAEDYEGALEYLLAAQDIDDTNDGGIENKIAYVYAALGDTENAAKYYLISIDLEPDNKDAFTYLVDHYLADEDYEAIAALKKKAPSKDILELFATIIVPAPYFSLEEGTYNGIRTLELKGEGDYPIYYTLDGEEPTVASGILYSGPIELTIGTTLVKAAAYDEKRGEYSQTISGSYTITVKAPEPAYASPEGGRYTEPQYVTLSTDSEEGSIYYTMDGTAPTRSSELYTEPFLLPLGDTHLAVAVINDFDIRSEINYYEFYYGAF